MLGVELDTLYRYARRGEIRALKLGRLWRFAEADVDTFVEARRASVAHNPDTTIVQVLPDLLKAAHGSNRATVLLSTEHRLSATDLDQQSDRLAHALLHHGVGRGDRVVLVLPNCVEFVVACFAVWKIGAILVPESPSARPAHLLHILSDAQPAAMILDGALAEQLEASAEPFVYPRLVFVKDRTFTLGGVDASTIESLDAVLGRENADKPLPSVAIAADDVASITYTSGSTGTAKGVMHTHESWLAGAAFSRDFPQVTSADTLVVPLPLYHGLAFRQILAYLWAGGTVVIATDIYQTLKWLRELRPTALLLVPAACSIILDHFATVLRQANTHLRYVEIGSAAMPPERLAQLQLALPDVAVHLPYGLTEARVGFLERGEEGLLNRIAAVATGLELRVESPEGTPVSSGETGEIVLKGRGLMKGYWNRSNEEEIRQLRETGFRTGDFARVNGRGQAELLGRLDDVVKIGGRKVIPQEIEMVLNRHEAVAESAVIARPDSKGIFEHELHAYVVLRDGARQVDALELLDFCRTHVQPYKLPAHVHFRRSLPKSSVGKILRHAL